MSWIEVGLRANKRATSRQNDEPTEKRCERALRDGDRHPSLVGLRTRKRVPECLPGAGDLVGRSEEVMHLALRQERMRGVPIQRAALRDHDRPGAQVRPPGGCVRAAHRNRYLIDEVVVEILDPDVFQVRRDAVAGERVPHQIDEPLVLAAALDAAAPRLRRPQGPWPVRLDPVAIGGIEVAVRNDGAGTIMPS